MVTPHTGLVIKVAGNLYKVKDLSTGQQHDCRIRGKLRLKDLRTTNPVTVGDLVHFETGDTPVITALQPRRNYIIRRSTNLSKEAHIVAANIDQAVLVATVDYPRTNVEFIDRFLVTAEAYRIPVVILLHKTDLYTTPEQQQTLHEWTHIYGTAGYNVLHSSIRNPQDVATIKQLLADKITLLSGNSGVGKSSLINAIYPAFNARVGEISSYHEKGKHTTTFSEMYQLESHTYIVDTPGIKGFGLVGMQKEEISHFFPEIFARAADCRFYNCTHAHEPGCAVEQAVQQGLISYSRYLSYLKILEEDEDSKYRS